jgi:hypothetical protein
MIGKWVAKLREVGAVQSGNSRHFFKTKHKFPMKNLEMWCIFFPVESCMRSRCWQGLIGP